MADRSQTLSLYLETKWLPVEQLADLALEVNWQCIDSSFQAARDFYATVSDPDELRWLAAAALAAAGWTNAMVIRRKS